MRVIDPITLRRYCHLGAGLVGFFDLLNLDNVSAILTSDLGVLDEAGQLSLHGRAPQFTYPRLQLAGRRMGRRHDLLRQLPDLQQGPGKDLLDATQAIGFSAEVARAGLEAEFSAWNEGDALDAMRARVAKLESEIRPKSVLVIAAGTLPASTLRHVLFARLLGAQVFLKCATETRSHRRGDTSGRSRRVGNALFERGFACTEVDHRSGRHRCCVRK